MKKEREQKDGKQAETSNKWQAGISIHFSTENNQKQDKTYIFLNKEVSKKEKNSVNSIGNTVTQREKKHREFLKN